MTRRFAQLTYTSYEPEDGSRGGWQVKEASTDLEPSERESALSYVPAEIRLARSLSKYPTPQETKALPRRLLYTPSASSAGLFVHSCPAGTDGSGREGNIFTHVLLDREVTAMLEGSETFRPIQMWRSPGWLTPFGPGAVRTAIISEDKPPPPVDDQISRERIAAFICSAPQRVEAIAALVDAALAALRGGPRVVIVADDVDGGAAWLAAVTMLTGGPSALSLSFCTLESSADVRTSGPRTLLSVVLSAESRALAASAPPNVVVIDPAKQAPPSGGQWQPFLGAAFDQSRWSELVRVASSGGEELLSDRMLAIDELSHINSELEVAEPHWALAVAMAEQPRFADHWELVASVMIETTPEGDLPDDTLQAFRSLLAHRPTGSKRLAAILEEAVSAHANECLVFELYRAYVCDVLVNPQALLENEPPAAPYWAPLSRSTDLVGRFLADLPEFLVRFPGDIGGNQESAVAALRALDMLLRAGAPFDPAQPVLRELLERGVAGLQSDAGEAVIEAVGAYSDELRYAVSTAGSLNTPTAGTTDVYGDASTAYSAANASVDYGQPADRVAEVVTALSGSTDPNVSPRDWTWKVLRQIGKGTPWSIEELVGLAEAIGPRTAVDLTSEACSALLEEGLREPSARLAELVVEHNESVGRITDDWQNDLLWLARVLGDPLWSSRVGDYRTAARVLALGLTLGMDRNHVEEEQWLSWAPVLVVAASRLLTVPPVHLDFPQVVSALAGIDVTSSLAQVIAQEGLQVYGCLRRALQDDIDMTRGVILSAWRLTSGRILRTAVPPDFLSVQTEINGERRPIGEAIASSFIRQGLSVPNRLWDVLSPAVDGADRHGLAEWLQRISESPADSYDMPTSTTGRYQA